MKNKKEPKNQKEISSQIKEFQDKLRECEKLKQDYLKGWQRERADFLNYKKNELERWEKLKRELKKEILLKILEILDDLERAKNQFPANLKNSDWGEGFFQIEKSFLKFLKEEKVEEIKSENEKFNPDYHQVIEQIEKEGEESGKIVEVLEKGYLLEGQVLRPAKVKVVK